MRISDWSSDVCSSDLAARCEIPLAGIARSTPDPTTEWPDDWSRARSTPTSRLNCAMRAGPFRRASSSFSTEEFDLQTIFAVAHRLAHVDEQLAHPVGRLGAILAIPDERHVGTDCIRHCRSRWSP